MDAPTRRPPEGPGGPRSCSALCTNLIGRAPGCCHEASLQTCFQVANLTRRRHKVGSRRWRVGINFLQDGTFKKEKKKKTLEKKPSVLEAKSGPDLNSTETSRIYLFILNVLFFYLLFLDHENVLTDVDVRTTCTFYVCVCFFFLSFSHQHLVLAAQVAAGGALPAR